MDKYDHRKFHAKKLAKEQYERIFRKEAGHA